jgi:FMN phosphatase YigB (HAD superfamily)
MVGDSLAHDIEGALAIGMRGVLVARAGRQPGTPADLPVIQSLRELPAHL